MPDPYQGWGWNARVGCVVGNAIMPGYGGLVGLIVGAVMDAEEAMASKKPKPPEPEQEADA